MQQQIYVGGGGSTGAAVATAFRRLESGRRLTANLRSTLSRIAGSRSRFALDAQAALQARIARAGRRRR